MFLRSDFIQIIESIIDDYPDLAVYFRAGDPRGFMAIRANAEMVAMLSQQMELAGMEVFDKSRDTTILADAALKGILPKAIPCIVNVRLENRNSSGYSVSAGRILVDSSGREYTAIESVTIPAGSSGTFKAEQKTTEVMTHTFELSEPFAKVEIPTPSSDKYISGISVTDSLGNQFSYAYRYTNIEADEKVYHVETDQYRRMYVTFGYSGISGNGGVGYQPAAQESFVIGVSETYGDVTPKQGSPFIFDYALSQNESYLTMTMDSMELSGSNPPDIATLRSLTNYPSTYDDNAVYHGEYDRLLRRHLSGFNFLSVWNEQREEEVRGASVDNINGIFVSVAPSTDGLKSQIEEIIKAADDSYRIHHVEPIESPYGISIRAEVARIYRLGNVVEQLKILLVSEYGKKTGAEQKGSHVPTVQQVTSLIKTNILALQDVNSDFTISVNVADFTQPERWHFLSEELVNIQVTESNQSVSMYGR